MPEIRQGPARLQFELSSDALAELDHLQAVGGFQTRKDLLNNALTLMSWAIQHAHAGHAVIAIDDKAGAAHELNMPFLAYAAQKAAR